MTPLIKFGAAPRGLSVRPLSHSEAGTIDRDLPDTDPAISILEKQVRDLQQAIADMSATHAVSLETARAEARKEAEQSFARDDAKALNALRAGIGEASDSLEARLSDLDGLALLVSQAALAKAFGNPAHYQDMVTRAIALCLSELRRETVLRIIVSALDFPDEAKLKALGNQSGPSRIEIQRDSQLTAGNCRIDLRLGQIEISLPKHWAALQTLFARLANVTRP